MFYAKTSTEYNVYATIKKDGSLGWIPRGKATMFKDEADAVERIGAAAAKTKFSYGRHPSFESRDLFPIVQISKPIFGEDGSLAGSEATSGYAYDPARLRESFVLEALVATADLRDGFAMIYAKSERGWLSTPISTSSYSKHEWSLHFADAKAFQSPEEARAAAASKGARCLAILQASAMFTQIDMPDDMVDDGLRSLGAAIDARDIRLDLEKARQDRLDALEKAGGAGAKIQPAKRI